MLLRTRGDVVLTKTEFPTGTRWRFVGECDSSGVAQLRLTDKDAIESELTHVVIQPLQSYSTTTQVDVSLLDEAGSDILAPVISNVAPGSTHRKYMYAELLTGAVATVVYASGPQTFQITLDQSEAARFIVDIWGRPAAK